MADPASADDAVQETWLAALRRRPDASRPLRPWLARVLGNAVRRLRRGRARADARERAAARPEALPDAARLREREALLRRLLDAVLALPDAQREAVLLRYYEALPPRRIAERLGVPVEHVYARLARAVNALRSRLDAAHGGQRAAWMLPLAGTLGLPPGLLPASLATASLLPAAAAGGTTAGATAGVAASAALNLPAAAGTLSGALVMSSASTAAVVVLSLGAGLGAGWWLKGREAPSQADPVELGARSPGAGGATAGSPAGSGPSLEGQEPAARAAALEREARELRERNAALESRVGELTARVKELTPVPLDPKALRFGLSGTTPAFDKADWDALSGHMSEMTKIMPQLRATMLAGQQPGPELVRALTEHNTPLAIFAVSAAAELKGTGPNGAYTHPAVIANLIRAALLQANDPLTPAQEAGIVALGGSWAAEEERRLKALAPDAPALAATVGEVDGKQRFLDSVKALLSASQRAVLFNPETEGRLGLDLLSPALVYMIGITPAEETDVGALPAKALETLFSGAGVKDVDLGPLHPVGQRWLDEIPRGRDPHPPADPELRFPRLETIQGFARAQVAAVQRLIESGRLTPEQTAKLRKLASVIAPYVVGKP